MDTNLKKFHVMKCNLTAPNGTLDSQIWDKNASATYIQNGSIVVVTPQGAVLNASSVVPEKLIIRARQDDSLYQSIEFAPNEVSEYKVTTYRPSINQCTITGYNGTDGDFTTNLVKEHTYQYSIFREDVDYLLGVDNVKSVSYKQGSNPLLAYLSPTVAGVTTVNKAEVVLSLVDFMYKEYIKTITGFQPWEIPIKVEALCDYTNGTKTASGCAITVSQDSNAFTFGSGTLHANIIVGSILNIAGKVYVVKTIDRTAKTGTLTMGYQGSSATVASGTTVASQVFVYTPATSTNVNTEKWGIMLTGRDKFWAENNWNYKKVRFQAGSTDLYVDGATRTYGLATVFVDKDAYGLSADVAAGALISGIAANEGVGDYKAVTEIESKWLGFHGVEKSYRLSITTPTFRKLISQLNGDVPYSLLTLEIKRMYKERTNSVINDSATIIVAIPVTYNVSTGVMAETIATDAGYGFVTVLDKMLTGLKTAQATKVTVY